MYKNTSDLTLISKSTLKNMTLIKVCHACMAAAYLMLMYNCFLSVSISLLLIKRERDQPNRLVDL